MNQKPSKDQINDLIKKGLKEDVGSGDITTRSILTDNDIFIADIQANNNIVLCGLNITKAVFQYLDSTVEFHNDHHKEGDFIASGERLLKIKGKGTALLEGERLALNILQHLCSIASYTREFVNLSGSIEILDTRKTTPGLRVFEKYAVRCGGGKNHRFGLFDAILIKDNHIKAAGGINQAVAKLKSKNTPNTTIEVETSNLKEVQEAIESKCDIIMLDNMPISKMKEAVKLIKGKAKIEVSGNINLKSMDEIRKLDIDYISIGAITHSPRGVDIGMNISST